MVDMHCHLDLYPDPFDMAKQCKEKRLYLLSVTTTPSAWHGTSNLAKENPRIRTALGLHPQLAHQRSHELGLFDALISETKYVGEIGLDGGKGYKEHWGVQLKVFRHILKSVKLSGGRIMSIHSRASASAVLSELAQYEGVPILHWFTGSKTELKKAIAMGCWFSVGPAMLATKRGQELVSIMPKERVLTETDGPFAKVSGYLLNPWDVNVTYKQFAAVWDMPPVEVEERILGNFRKLVSLT